MTTWYRNQWEVVTLLRGMTFCYSSFTTQCGGADVSHSHRLHAGCWLMTSTLLESISLYAEWISVMIVHESVWCIQLILIWRSQKVPLKYITSTPLTLLFVVVPQDRAYEIVEDMEANKVRKMKKRICLVLDCLCAHDFSDKTADLINLQHYVIKEKRLSEREAIVIFYDVVRVVEALHKVSLRQDLGGLH